MGKYTKAAFRSTLGIVVAASIWAVLVVSASLWPYGPLLAGPVDARVFGVLCNGSLDVTTQMQGALNVFKTVILPEGVCNITATIQLNSSNDLGGAGPYSTSINTGAGWNINNIVVQSNGKTGVSVHDLAVIGNTASRPVSLVQFTSTTNCSLINTRLATSAHESAGLVQNTTDCLIQGNRVSDVSGTGWGISMFWGALRNRVIGNEIIDTGTYGISIDDGTSNQVGSIASKGNIVADNIIYNVSGAMWCIGVEGSSYNIVHNNYCNAGGSVGISITEGNSNTVLFPIGNIIHDNIITANTSVASIGIDQEGGSNNIIHHNRIAAGDIGIKYGTGQTTAMLNNVADANEIDSTSSGAGVSQTGITTTTPYVNGLKITNNEIYSPGYTGIQLQAGNDISVTGNKILSSGKEGILDTTAGSSHEIIGNKILNASASSAGTYAAIRLQPASSVMDRIIVAHNIFDDLQGSPTNTIGLFVIGGGGTFTRIQAYDNISLKSTIIPLKLTSVAGGVYGKIVPQTLTNSAGTVTPNSVADGDILDITLTAAVTTFATPSYIADGATFTIRVTQGGTGGYNVTFDGGYKTSWSNTGNTTGKIATITLQNQGGTLIQQAFSGYM